MAKKKKTDVLYRVVKFEIKPDLHQLLTLMWWSDTLRQVWNIALAKRKEFYEQQSLFKLLFLLDMSDIKRQGWNSSAFARFQIYLSVANKQMTLFDQINTLTALRAANPQMGSITRNPMEETLDALDGSYKSYFQLKKNSDPKAQLPRFKSQQYFFSIPGRGGFRIKNGVIKLTCNAKGAAVLEFPIPQYCQNKIDQALKVKKFTLYRDQPRYDKPGRMWISLAYEIPKPEAVQATESNTVYVALGASWIGVLTSHQGQVIKLWRPDKFWRPKIDELVSKMSSLKKYSRRWTRMNEAKRTMQRKMSNQQKQNQREVVQRLLKLGDMFIVQDLTLRCGIVEKETGREDLNWGIQNTGSIGRLLRQLKEKTAEYGKQVMEIEPKTLPPYYAGKGKDNKIAMAERLKQAYINNQF